MLCVITFDSLIKYHAWHIVVTWDHKAVHSIIYLSSKAIVHLGFVDRLELIHNLLFFTQKYSIFIQLPDFFFSSIDSIFFVLLNIHFEIKILFQVFFIINIEFIILFGLCWMYLYFCCFWTINFNQIFVCNLEFLKTVIIKFVVIIDSIIIQM